VNVLTVDDIAFLIQVFACFAVFFGACVGSFLNVCIYRIPNELSVVRPRSHCPKCGRMIPWYLNIPVISWLALRGKCAWCKTPISSRYLFVELLTAALFLAVFAAWCTPEPFGFSPIAQAAQIPVYWLFMGGLILGTFVDFDHFILPDRVTIGGMVAGPILSALVPAMHGETVWWRGLLDSGIGLTIGFCLLLAIGLLGEKVFKKEAMGFGDVKLMGAIGAFLGWKAVLFTLFASSLVGSVVGLLLMALRRAGMKDMIPFGPYLALGSLLWLFWGERLLMLYLAFMRGA